MKSLSGVVEKDEGKVAEFLSNEKKIIFPYLSSLLSGFTRNNK